MIRVAAVIGSIMVVLLIVVFQEYASRHPPPSHISLPQWEVAENPCLHLLYKVPIQGHCIPIEPLDPSYPEGPNKWALWQARQLITPRLGRYVDLSRYRSRIYIDLGANWYRSSVAKFRAEYPQGKTFRIVAFEPVPTFWPSYDGHPEVELVKLAAWTHNSTVSFSDPGTEWGSVTKNSSTRVHTIDLVEFLTRTVHAEDFVVVKMDIETSEYMVIPDMIRRNVLPLIDELFVEVHFRGLHDFAEAEKHSRAEAMLLLHQLRNLNVYCHEWY